MSHKTSPARVEAFFRALGETGNQTIAAERAKVSRSWVSLHQSTDPDFRARMTAAVEAAKARLRAQASGVAPPTGWGSIDGEELVMRGANGRRTQIARARMRQWTPRVEARFLSALAACCNVKAACALVGLSQASAYNHYARWPGFAKGWDDALETGYLRLDMAMIENACRAAEMPDYLPDLPMPRMTFDEAIQLLRLHQARVRDAAKRPGAPRTRRLTSDEAFASVAKKLDRFERSIACKAGARAADQRAVARGVRIVGARGGDD